MAFLEPPAEVAFLHRPVLTAQLVITLVGAGGIRLTCLFLELSGLDRFVAASYDVQRKVTADMEEAVAGLGQEKQQRLAKNTEPKQITVCEDETFHPAVCLVAIEPVSNFILLEQTLTTGRLRPGPTLWPRRRHTFSLSSCNLPVMKAGACCITWR